MAGAQQAGHESVPEGALPVDSTLRRAAVIFRLLGWAWMFMLGIVTLISDKEANPAVVVGTMVLVTAWTVGTLLQLGVATRHAATVLAFKTGFVRPE